MVMSKSVICKRMDKLFGEVDYVAAGEFEAEERVEKVDSLAVDHIAHEHAHTTIDKKNAAKSFLASGFPLHGRICGRADVNSD
jgi:hypothetical protein